MHTHPGKAIALVTGVKLTEAKKLFNAGQRVTTVGHDNRHYKMNAGAGALSKLHADYEVFATGYQESDRAILQAQGWIHDTNFMVADLLDKQQVREVVSRVKELKQSTGLDVHLVHYGGASDTKVALPHNSLYAHTWHMAAEALPDLVANNCVTLINLMQEMKLQGIFDGQPISKVLFISATAAVRTKMCLGLDAAQKGAGHNLIRNIALDVTHENIFVTEIMPGSTDTGFFDNEHTLKAAVGVTRRMGYDVTEETYPLFSADQIGDAVRYALDANCNVREVVLLPYGQHPHLGA